jgi:glycosyltransferase involved in cell wall biosynthesis
MKKARGQRDYRRTASQRPQPALSKDDAGTRLTYDIPPLARGTVWPPISVCMIVKNEAANLAACLQSLSDLATELIVVDTGSTDSTVEIAEKFGAEVHHFDWINDFSAARNESLAYARQPWIFWLDADDRVSVVQLEGLKAAAASGIADAYICKVASHLPDGSFDTTTHVRLFRNRVGIRFEGAVHESVMESLRENGLRLANTNVLIDHLGYHTSSEVMRQKRERNLELIEHQIRKHPDDSDWLFYRGQTLGGLNHEAAMADLEAYLSKTVPSSPFHYKRFWCYVSLAANADKHNDWGRLEALMHSGLGEFVDHPYFLAVLGRRQLDTGQVDEGLTALQTAYRLNQGEVEGFRPPEPWLLSSLGRAWWRKGDNVEAIKWVDKALALDEKAPGAAELRVRLLLDRGDTEAVGGFLPKLLTPQSGPEVWLVKADYHSQRAEWAEAQLAVKEAESRGLPEKDAGELATKLGAMQVLYATRSRGGRISKAQFDGVAMLAQGQPLRAAEALANAIEAEPEDPDNYRYLAVALEKLGQREQAVEAWQIARHFAVGAAGGIE